VIALIRSAADTEAAKNGLMETFELSERQAVAILELRLRALTALERKSVEDEYKDIRERIDELRALLGDESKIDALIKDELLELKGIYGPLRRPADRDRGRGGGARARGPDRGRRHGDRDHALGLHQAPPVTAYREQRRGRHRRDGDGPEGRGLHRAPVRGLDARLHPVLHDPSARSTG
jgi:DNA gyrase/topoisomerase IV subunit A